MVISLEVCQDLYKRYC